MHVGAGDAAGVAREDDRAVHLRQLREALGTVGRVDEEAAGADGQHVGAVRHHEQRARLGAHDTLDAVTQRRTRGDTRQRVTGRLAELDRLMLDAARAQMDEAALQSMRAEAAEELSPFRDRMPEETYQRAIESAVDRLVRTREQLPTIAFE